RCGSRCAVPACCAGSKWSVNVSDGGIAIRLARATPGDGGDADRSHSAGMRYGRREGRPGALRTKPRNAIVLVSLCASLWGCADDPVRPADTDRDPPSLTVEFPAAGAYDDDGDALVDVRLSWS